MKYLLMAALALGGTAAAGAAYEEEGLSETAVSTDAVRSGGDEEEEQPLIQENDEDLTAFVTDYIRKDIQLKGAFLVENRSDKKILKLQLASVDQKTETGESGEKKVTAVFKDAAGKNFSVVFHLQNGAWGGLDIFKLELKSAARAPAPAKK